MCIRCFVFVALFFAATAARGQFSDSVNNRVQLGSTNSINKTEDGSAYLSNNTLRYTLRHRDIQLNFNNNWLYGKQNRNLTNNDFSSSLDFNLYKTFPNFYYWGLLNYNTSYSLQVRNQLLSGVGIAYNFFDTDSTYLNLSNGILYDASSLIINEHRTNYHTIRNSLRLSYRFVVRKLVVVSGTNFWQPSLRHAEDFSIRLDNSVGLKLNEWLTLTGALAYNRVNLTGRENLLYTYGLNFDYYF